MFEKLLLLQNADANHENEFGHSLLGCMCLYVLYGQENIK